MLDNSVPRLEVEQTCGARGAAGIEVRNVHLTVFADMVPTHTLMRSKGSLALRADMAREWLRLANKNANGHERILLEFLYGKHVVLSGLA